MGRPRFFNPLEACLVWLAALVVTLMTAVPVHADEPIQFPALDNNSVLAGFLYRPTTGEPAAAIVMLHGCSGLASKKTGPYSLYRAWRDLLIEQGYVVLMVDSAGSRGLGQTCTSDTERRRMWTERPYDAYAGLAFLQRQPFVRPDRVALMGWSQGGGTVLLAIPTHGGARPSPPPAHDFAAAVAFYPGGCNERYQSRAYAGASRDGWSRRIPLFVLQGDADNWTQAAPCESFLRDVQARGSPVTFQIYPGAAHGFDAPNTPVQALEKYRRGNWAPVVGTNPAARDDARARVGTFLAAHLAPANAH